MPKFRLNSSDPAEPQGHIEAPTLVGALAKVLGRFSPESSGTVNIDVSVDGLADVWDDDTDHRVRLEPEDISVFEVGTDPTAELWDAPTPGSGARSAMEMSAIDESKAIDAIKAIECSGSALEACNLALDALMTHIPAESGSILLAEMTRLRFVCVRGPKADVLVGQTIGLGDGIAGAVLSSGNPIQLRQARQHRSHHTAVDQTLDHFTRTLLAMPIAVDGQHRGVLELLNPFGSEAFVEAHQTFAHAVTLALGDRLAGQSS